MRTEAEANNCVRNPKSPQMVGIALFTILLLFLTFKVMDCRLAKIHITGSYFLLLLPFCSPLASTGRSGHMHLPSVSQSLGSRDLQRGG